MIDYRAMSRRKLATLLNCQDSYIWVYLRGSNMGVAGFICLLCFVSIYLFAHNNIQPLDGEGQKGPWQGETGGVEVPASTGANFQVSLRAVLGSWVGCMRFAHQFSFCSYGDCQLGGREMAHPMLLIYSFKFSFYWNSWFLAAARQAGLEVGRKTGALLVISGQLSHFPPTSLATLLVFASKLDSYPIP